MRGPKGTPSILSKGYALFNWMPRWASRPIHAIGVVLIGPFLTAYRTGYLRSAFKMAAVSRSGEPLPWYSYPCVDFLRFRDFSEKSVLEFGGGQSTLWWAKEARLVVTLEGDEAWYSDLVLRVPDNVRVHHVSMASRDTNVAAVQKILAEVSREKYDVIVIDGLYRRELVPIALERLSEDGIIICDNAEGYGFFEAFRSSGLARVDFFGNSAGGVLPHATSIYFRLESCFAFDAKYPIPVWAEEV